MRWGGCDASSIPETNKPSLEATFCQQAPLCKILSQDFSQGPQSATGGLYQGIPQVTQKSQVVALISECPLKQNPKSLRIFILKITVTSPIFFYVG